MDFMVCELYLNKYINDFFFNCKHAFSMKSLERAIGWKEAADENRGGLGPLQSNPPFCMSACSVILHLRADKCQVCAELRDKEGPSEKCSPQETPWQKS